MVSELTKELAKALLEEAGGDLASAGEHRVARRWHKAVFEAQQCVEKAMNAALACEGLTHIADHDPSSFFAVEVVMKAPQEWAERLRSVLRSTPWLMAQYSAARYARITARRVVTPLRSYREEDAEAAVKAAKEAYDAIRGYVESVLLPR